MKFRFPYKTYRSETTEFSGWLHRVFRIRPFDECRNIGYWRRVIDHTIAGAILGVIILHPLSMIAHSIFHLGEFRFWNIIILSFSSEHITMAVFFLLIGIAFGYVHGSYIHIISTLYEKIRQSAITDELTGLFNRRFFINRLEQEVARALRYNHPLSLMMIDIDSFKCFNDTHGHVAGDKLLEEIGHLFRSLIRESDFAARYGGEEFVIVMSEAESEMALSLAQRICGAISIHPFRHRETQPGGKVTISAGIASFPTDAYFAEQLILKADQALYRAKRKGKNRVCRASLICKADEVTLQPT